MKTYEVSIRPFGVKRIYKTYTVHSDNKAKAERVAETAFYQDEPDKYNLPVRWQYRSEEIK